MISEIIKAFAEVIVELGIILLFPIWYPIWFYKKRKVK